MVVLHIHVVVYNLNRADRDVSNVSSLCVFKTPLPYIHNFVAEGLSVVTTTAARDGMGAINQYPAHT